jgi:xanthine dehydrogenase accessory factor
MEVIEQGIPRLVEFGVADDSAWEVGLACGGTIKVFIEPGWSLDSIYEQLKEYLVSREPFAIVSVLEGGEDILNHKILVKGDGEASGDLSLLANKGIDINDVLGYLDEGKSTSVDLKDGTRIFVESHSLPPKLIIVGAVHLAEKLITIANSVGFDTILIDPREAFASRERFPHVKELMLEWPEDAMAKLSLDKSAYIAVLTHDPKLDDPALKLALNSNARYVGALGSRRTNQKRFERLQKSGLSEDQLSKLHAPIGLDLGGRSQGEIAISIMAEILQIKHENA